LCRPPDKVCHELLLRLEFFGLYLWPIVRQMLLVPVLLPVLLLLPLPVLKILESELVLPVLLL
jgi:hypothetical protein